MHTEYSARVQYSDDIYTHKLSVSEVSLDSGCAVAVMFCALSHYRLENSSRESAFLYKREKELLVVKRSSDGAYR